ncbi:hypothetical protein ACH5RR_003511 [Cinchona calisaya]|uniref:Uncharacterized protein n=1 Tax=Cinchona calisaya TaxID=153742 RepID=A0ABD3AV29_9GENT
MDIHWRIAQWVQHRHFWNLPDLEKDDKEILSGGANFVDAVLQHNEIRTIMIFVIDDELALTRQVKHVAQLASVVGYVVRRHSLLKDIRTYDEIPVERKECLYGSLMVPDC